MSVCMCVLLFVYSLTLVSFLLHCNMLLRSMMSLDDDDDVFNDDGQCLML